MIDQAQVVEALHREAAVSAHFGRVGFKGVSASHCEEARCGAPIPEARRRAMPGVTRCVECQALLERRSRMGGR